MAGERGEKRAPATSPARRSAVASYWEQQRARRKQRDTRRKEIALRERKEAGEDRELDPPKPPPDLAFDGMLSPYHLARLAKTRARREACGKKVIEIQHEPCGSHWFLNYGCNAARICERCGPRYASKRMQWYLPIARLNRHIAEVETVAPDSSLKFLTLTFPNVDPSHEFEASPADKSKCGACALSRAEHWGSPDDCRAWFRKRTKLLRQFFEADPLYGNRKRAPRRPYAAPNWNAHGYLAVWEVTPERVCRTCGGPRKDHNRVGTRVKPFEHPWTPVTDAKGRKRCTVCGEDERHHKNRHEDGHTWEKGEKTGRYHPHLHVLLWSNFIPWKQIAARWEHVTGARVVDIRAVENDGTKCVAYLLKYLGKSWEGVPDDIQVAALHRTRRLTSTGQFYGSKFRELRKVLVRPDEKLSHVLRCPQCGPRAGLPFTRRDDPEHVLALAEAVDPWRPAVCVWRTLRVMPAGFMPMSGRPAMMAPVTWAGAIAGKRDGPPPRWVATEDGETWREEPGEFDPLAVLEEVRLPAPDQWLPDFVPLLEDVAPLLADPLGAPF